MCIRDRYELWNATLELEDRQEGIACTCRQNTWYVQTALSAAVTTSASTATNATVALNISETTTTTQQTEETVSLFVTGALLRVSFAQTSSLPWIIAGVVLFWIFLLVIALLIWFFMRTKREPFVPKCYASIEQFFMRKTAGSII